MAAALRREAAFIARGGHDGGEDATSSCGRLGERRVASTSAALHSADMEIMLPASETSIARERSRRTNLVTECARWLLLACFSLSALGCGYNEVIERDEDVKAGWAEVQNQYKRRADLVPNLVNVVKGSANFERDTLEKVVEARASVGKLNIDSSTIDDPQKLAQFEAAQAKLSGALSRLLVVAEAYPDLKASAQYRDLQSQLEGTENRIAVARKRYIETVSEYNKTVLRFPSSIGASIRGKKERPNFSGNPADETAPEVKF
jgi:LemA protein